LRDDSNDPRGNDVRRLIRLTTLALACGAFAAGCGGDDNDTAGEGGNGAAQEQAAPPATQTEAPDTATEAAEAGGQADAAVQQAVEQCKQSVQAAPQLSDDVKSDLEELCDKAASGDQGAVREATREVCTKIVEESVPEGPARDQALDACKQAGG
jgi:hypothetical protein